MWKYIVGAGILVLGFALGFAVRHQGSSVSPEEAPLQAVVASPASTVAAAASPADSSETIPLAVKTDATRTIVPPPTASGEKQPETAPVTEGEGSKPSESLHSASAPTAEDFLSVIREKRGTPEADQAVRELASRYRKEGKERRAMSVELEGATGPDRAQTLARIEEMNKTLLTPGKASPNAEFYTVKSGDTLSEIGSQFKITPRFIMKLNGLKSDVIRIGQKLKLVPGPFTAAVDKSHFRLTVFLGDEVFKEYPIGLGANGSTPAGKFTVQGKLTEPTWWHKGVAYDYGDPKNPLGTRWITLKKGYGVHGTWEDGALGKAASQGCVRMRNKDVEELYDLLVPHHSTVTVQE